MIKTKLTLSVLFLILSTASVFANPIASGYTSEPEPVHGMQDLENRTIFPTFEQDQGNDGYVLLNFHVDVVGNISNIVVAKSSGSHFDKSAIDAVINTDWNPAMQNSKAIAVTYQMPFEFYAK